MHPTKSIEDGEDRDFVEGKGKEGSSDEDPSQGRGNLSGEDHSHGIDGDEGDEDGYFTDQYADDSDNEQVIQQQQEPKEDAVNGLPFFNFFCFRLEKLWKRKREKQAHKRWKEKEKLEYILPRQMLNDLKGQSVYPYLRLLLPEQDSRRQFRVKEKKIAEAYCKAQGFGKGTKNFEMLMVRFESIE